MIKNLSFLLLLIMLSSCMSKNDDLLGYDIRLFDEVADFANAVETQNVQKIYKLVHKDKSYLNYQEPKFGHTLLIWAVWSDKLLSVKTLLDAGANPNIQNHVGETALMHAAEREHDSRYIKILLDNHADPNLTVYDDKEESGRLISPLIASVLSYDLKNMRLLVDSGANINYYYKPTHTTALSRAVLLSQVDMAHYLLLEKKADFKVPLGKDIGGNNIYITNYLRGWVFDLDSEDHAKKMEMVEYMKKNGLDYFKTKIPLHYFKNYSKDFLDKY